MALSFNRFSPQTAMGLPKIRFAAQKRPEEFTEVVASVVPATANVTTRFRFEYPKKLGWWKRMQNRFFQFVGLPPFETTTVTTGNQYGSGFWLRCRDGRLRLVTNAHVVECRDEKLNREPHTSLLTHSATPNLHRLLAKVQQPGDPVKIPLRIARNDTDHPAVSRRLDIAVMEATDDALLPPETGALVLADESDLLPGTPVFKIGNGARMKGSLARGVLSGFREGQDIPHDCQIMKDVGKPDIFLLETDLTLNPGDSGSPLLDRQGRLIGINFAVAAPGIAYALRASDVKILLERWGFLEREEKPDPSPVSSS